MRAAGVVGRLVLATALIVPASATGEPLRVASFNLLHGGLTSALHGDAEGLEDRLRFAPVSSPRWPSICAGAAPPRRSSCSAT